MINLFKNFLHDFLKLGFLLVSYLVVAGFIGWVLGGESSDVNGIYEYYEQIELAEEESIINMIENE